MGGKRYTILYPEYGGQREKGNEEKKEMEMEAWLCLLVCCRSGVSYERAELSE